MKTTKRDTCKILLIIFFLFLSPIFPGQSSASLLSIKEETELGRKFLTSIRKHFELVDDESAMTYINELGQYLERFFETKPFTCRFYIINNSDLNAFAGPGGHIFFYSGLIEVMDNVDELAAVMTHEIGHVSGRHIAHRIEKSKKIGLATLAGMLAGVLVGGKATGAIVAGTRAAGIQAQLSFSRNDERHADQMGFKYIVEGGFKPSGMLSILKKLVKGQWSGVGSIPSYLLTHPGGPERMANVDIMITEHGMSDPRPGRTKKFRSRFPFFKTVLTAMYGNPAEAERRFRKDINEDNINRAASLFGLGVLNKNRSDYARAIDLFKSALDEDPESIPTLINLGEVYQLKGEDHEAIKILEKALEGNSLNKSALFLLAASYLNLDQYRRSASIYERLINMKPVKNEVYYQLGVAYGRQEKLALAHYNFGQYFKRLRKRQKAEFHFEKALSLSANDPDIRQKIQKERHSLKPY